MSETASVSHQGVCPNGGAVAAGAEAMWLVRLPASALGRMWLGGGLPSHYGPALRPPPDPFGLCIPTLADRGANGHELSMTSSHWT